MDDHPTTRATLDDALARHAEAAALRAALAAARAEAEPLREQARAAVARHSVEADDVDHLEGLSLRALLASVRGSRAQDLHRERSEEDAAAAAAREALARLHAVEARAEDTERRLAGLRDTGAAVEAAVTAHAATVRAGGGPEAAETGAVLDELGVLDAETATLETARAAGLRAAAALEGAGRRLGSARSWSTYDTFAGGGMLSSALKHQHMDAASQEIAAAQAELVAFARVLDDPSGVAGLRADLGVDGLTRTLDVWFDNLVTDWTVRSRIAEAAARVDAALHGVRSALATTAAEQARLAARRHELRSRRDALLGIPRPDVTGP